MPSCWKHCSGNGRLLALWLSLFAGLAVCQPLCAGPLKVKREASIPALYPEGPVQIGARTFVAEMTAQRVIELQGTAIKPFWEEAGCGPTSISQASQGRLLVLCHLGGYLALITSEGKTVKRILDDENGGRVRFPNDSIADGNGGVYLSDAGLFAPGAPAGGSILYLSPELKLTRVASGIHYANGVAIHITSKRLYVSEHLGGRVLAYPLLGAGQLGEPATVLTREALKNAVGELDELSGPDGIEFYDEHSFLVCIYGRGVLLRVSIEGKVLDVIAAGPRYITNVARSGSRYIVTGADTNSIFPYAGSIGIYELGE